MPWSWRNFSSKNHQTNNFSHKFFSTAQWTIVNGKFWLKSIYLQSVLQRKIGARFNIKTIFVFSMVVAATKNRKFRRSWKLSKQSFGAFWIQYNNDIRFYVFTICNWQIEIFILLLNSFSLISTNVSLLDSRLFTYLPLASKVSSMQRL